LLTEDGLELPPGALCNQDYKGLTAEEIYPLIDKDTDEDGNKDLPVPHSRPHRLVK